MKKNWTERRNITWVCEKKCVCMFIGNGGHLHFTPKASKIWSSAWIPDINTPPKAILIWTLMLKLCSSREPIRLQCPSESTSSHFKISCGSQNLLHHRALLLQSECREGAETEPAELVPCLAEENSYSLEQERNGDDCLSAPSVVSNITSWLERCASYLEPCKFIFQRSW